MGVRRRLDFILASPNLVLQATGASNKLNLGSDHRAVQTLLVDKKIGKQVRYQSRVPTKGWCPELDAESNATKYCEVLDAALGEKSKNTLETLQKDMNDAATTPGVRVQLQSHQKPWQSLEVQELIRKRRMSNTSRERASISKAIQKCIREILRKH